MEPNEDQERIALAKAQQLEQPPVPAYGVGIAPTINPYMQQPQSQQPQFYGMPQQPMYDPNYAQQAYGYPPQYPQQYPPTQYSQPQPVQPQPVQIPVIDPKIKPVMSEAQAEKRFDETCICRCCHGGIEDGKDFIAPCQCSGSMKWVHRHCLDQWRTFSPNPQSFFKCDVCNADYQFEGVKDKIPTSKKVLSYGKYGCLVGFDFAILIAVWQIMVILCTAAIIGVDFFGYRYELYRKIYLPMPIHLPIIQGILYDYVVGHILFFFLLGVIATIFAVAMAVVSMCSYCCGKSGAFNPSSVTYENYHYHHYDDNLDWLLLYFCWYSYFWHTPSFYYAGPPVCCECFCCMPSHHHYHPAPAYAACDCDCCRGCDGNCGDCGDCGGKCDLDAAKGCDCGGDAKGIGVVFIIIGVIVLLIITIFVIIGVVAGLAIFLFLAYKILNRRLVILKRKEDVKFYRVADLSVYAQTN